MRCAWCERGVGWEPSPAASVLIPACDDHRVDSRDVFRAIAALRPPPNSIDWYGPHTALTQRLCAGVVARDARELRGERIDWTRPVPGWALW